MRHKILVIDDDYDILGILGVILHQAGYEVLQAASPQLGLKFAREEKPDLVLLDVMMPEMDGWEVARRLRKFSDAPIVFSTVLRDPEDIAQGLVLGDGYITKPFNQQELLEHIKGYLQQGTAGKQSPPEA